VVTPNAKPRPAITARRGAMVEKIAVAKGASLGKGDLSRDVLKAQGPSCKLHRGALWSGALSRRLGDDGEDVVLVKEDVLLVVNFDLRA
jgi:hypothetical protein